MQSRRVGPPLREVTALEVDGRLNLYCPATQELVALNGTASDVWSLCDGEHELTEIVELLAAGYQVTPASIAGDVRSTVAHLVQLGLLPAHGT